LYLEELAALQEVGLEAEVCLHMIKLLPFVFQKLTLFYLTLIWNTTQHLPNLLDVQVVAAFKIMHTKDKMALMRMSALLYLFQVEYGKIEIILTVTILSQVKSFLNRSTYLTSPAAPWLDTVSL
jgi:hypothetical protein